MMLKQLFWTLCSLWSFLILANNPVMACSLPSLPIPPCQPSQMVYGACLNPKMDEAIHSTESACFQEQFNNVVHQAQAYLDKIPASPNKVVITDLDETLLNNTDYYAQYKTFTPASWLAWDKKIHYNQSVLELLKKAKARGFSVMFITGRPPDQGLRFLEQTSDIPWDGFFFKPRTVHASSTVFKTSVRHVLQKMGYQIVLNIGDQYSDLDTPLKSYSQDFKLPNVLYFIP